MHAAQAHFNEEKNTLLLSVDSSHFDLAGLEPSAKENGLKVQKEFHITVIGNAAAQKIGDILKALSKEDQQATKEKIRELITATEWKYKARPELYVVMKQYPQEWKVSYIQLADCPAITAFYTKLGDLLETSCEIPVPHVTLYTKSNDGKGIGINSLGEFVGLNPVLIHREEQAGYRLYKKIIIPSELQVDTAVSVFLLKKFGVVHFPGIEQAAIEMRHSLPQGETEQSMLEKGTVLIDVGKGVFDHHDKEKITSTDLILSYLHLDKHPSLDKLRQFAQRDDFFGKGTLSTDPLDKAFGIPQMIVNLNKKYSSDPNAVMQVMVPIFDAHYFQEERRTIDLPKEFEEKLKNGEAETFSIPQGKHKLKCVFVASDNTGLAGYLRSHGGGRYDVVVINLSSGHMNILTRAISPTKRIDLRQLTAIVRRSEMMKRNDPTLLSMEELSQQGRLEKVPEWYFDPATNSLQNGGINPSQTKATSLTRKEIIQLVELGLKDKPLTEYY